MSEFDPPPHIQKVLEGVVRFLTDQYLTTPYAAHGGAAANYAQYVAANREAVLRFLASEVERASDRRLTVRPAASLLFAQRLIRFQPGGPALMLVVRKTPAPAGQEPAAQLVSGDVLYFIARPNSYGPRSGLMVVRVQ